jgi:hypothetical protein
MDTETEEKGNAVLRSTTALLEQEPEIADAFLLASVYCVAIRRGESPREICDRLFTSLPETSAWADLRDALLAATT